MSFTSSAYNRNGRHRRVVLPMAANQTAGLTNAIQIFFIWRRHKGDKPFGDLLSN
jgi:hypothetical protein